jgi:hypothetical protein
MTEYRQVSCNKTWHGVFSKVWVRPRTAGVAYPITKSAGEVQEEGNCLHRSEVTSVSREKIGCVPGDQNLVTLPPQRGDNYGIESN